jgi:hypothetical protein
LATIAKVARPEQNSFLIRRQGEIPRQFRGRGLTYVIARTPVCPDCPKLKDGCLLRVGRLS